MTQPPYPGSGEQPENQPWQPPNQPGPSFDKQQPPPYQGYGEQQQQPYGGQEQPYGGMPSYGGPGNYGYTDPSAGLASRWRRLGGYLIDNIIVSVVSGLITWPFPDPVRVETANDQVRYFWSGGAAALNLIVFVLVFVYYWQMTARFGQTVGKMAMKTRVVREDNGGAVSSGTAAWRYGIQILLAIPCGLGTLLDALWILWDPRKQTLHDKVAHTVVVDVVPTAPNPYAGR